MSYYIGLLSGTSVDGIDVALVAIKDNSIELIETHEQPFSDELKQTIQTLIKTQNISLQQYSDADIKCAHEFTFAIKQLLNKTELNTSDIAAIGSHGQTIFHQPEGECANTLQIGSSHVLAAQTGIDVISHFRNLDMAFKGQGAPLAPVIHQVLFAKENRNTAVINLGGIANISLVGKDYPQAIGFDTGPANCLIDEWISIHNNKAYDKSGQWAQQGQLNKPLLAAMLNDRYFQKAAPKSTGREYFNLNWVNKHLETHKNINPDDTQNTLTHLTAHSIADAINAVEYNIHEILLVGGGAHNDYLRHLIQEYTLINTNIEKQGDWVEAILFAYLAERRINQQSLNLLSITGANRALLYGDIVSVSG